MTALFDALAEQSDRDRPFLQVGGDRTWSYGEVFDLTARMATVLREHRAVQGARLMVQVEKSPESVALYLATLQVGAVYVPLNPAYTEAETRFFLDDLQPAVIVADPGNPCRPPGPEPGQSPVLTLAPDGSGTLLDQATCAAPDPFPSPQSGAETAAMLYTSGTTGRPKGAMLSSDNLLSNATTLCKAWGWRPADVLLHVLPIFHTHGLFVALHLAMLNGSKVLFHDRFSVDTTLAGLARSTVMMGVPTHYQRLLASTSLDDADLDGMRLFISGSAPLPALVHEDFERRTGHRILERYGMTETGMLTSNPLVGPRVAGSVGFALPGVEMRVTDEHGGPCPADQPGAVQVRGPNVFKGYWRSPDKTAAEFTDDRFFCTGDIGRLDNRGRLTLAGRSTDMIISGGLNVYPAEVERVLDAHPQVAESAVIGLPHPDFGEAVVAVLVAEVDLDIADVRATSEAELADFKRPKQFVVVDNLPRNPMGKVVKADLRIRFAHLYQKTDRPS